MTFHDHHDFDAVAFAAIPVVAVVGLELTFPLIAVALTAVAGWYGWTTWRSQQRSPSNGDDQSPTTLPRQPRSTPTDTSPTPSVDTGPARSVSSVPDTPVEEAFFTPDDRDSTTRCPECDRRFPDVFDVCPFDSTPLQYSDSSRDNTDDRRLARRTCPDCQRRYELSANFCPRDGQQLKRDSEYKSRNAPVFFICRTCGFETRQDLDKCPHDGQLLTRLDPEQRRSIRPAFPYNRCRQCGHIAAPDQTRCPVDDSLLLPAVSARLTALAPTGYGERRKLCPECGTQFGDECSFCSHDGAGLLVMN